MTTTANIRLASARQPNGQWAKGNCGRPLGAVGKVRRERLQRVQDCFDDALAGLREKLLQQDLAAIKIVLDYSLPKGQLVDLETSDLQAIIDAAMNGEISGDEAARLAQSAKLVSDSVAVRELMERLDALEAKHGIGGSAR